MSEFNNTHFILFSKTASNLPVISLESLKKTPCLQQSTGQEKWDDFRCQLDKRYSYTGYRQGKDHMWMRRPSPWEQSCETPTTGRQQTYDLIENANVIDPQPPKMRAFATTGAVMGCLSTLCGVVIVGLLAHDLTRQAKLRFRSIRGNSLVCFLGVWAFLTLTASLIILVPVTYIMRLKQSSIVKKGLSKDTLRRLIRCTHGFFTVKNAQFSNMHDDFRRHRNLYLRTGICAALTTCLFVVFGVLWVRKYCEKRVS